MKIFISLLLAQNRIPVPNPNPPNPNGFGYIVPKNNQPIKKEEATGVKAARSTVNVAAQAEIPPIPSLMLWQLGINNIESVIPLDYILILDLRTKGQISKNNFPKISNNIQVLDISSKDFNFQKFSFLFWAYNHGILYISRKFIETYKGVEKKYSFGSGLNSMRLISNEGYLEYIKQHGIIIDKILFCVDELKIN